MYMYMYALIRIITHQTHVSTYHCVLQCVCVSLSLSLCLSLSLYIYTYI